MSLPILANNLTLIISLLWCLTHAFMYAIPVVYALGHARGPLTYDANRSIKQPGEAHGGRGGLTFWSYLALSVAVISALIIAVACLGLGTGFTKQGVSALLLVVCRLMAWLARMTLMPACCILHTAISQC